MANYESNKLCHLLSLRLHSSSDIIISYYDFSNVLTVCVTITETEMENEKKKNCHNSQK